MKIAPAQTNTFLQKPDKAARVVLIYGPDAGLVRERADILAKNIVPDINDPFNTASLSAASLVEDKARLHDEMAAQSLMGGRRLVRIPHAAESMVTALTSLLADLPAADSLLIIEGGDLDKRSKIRALCEADPAAAAIACYVEEGAARSRAIGDILQAEGLSIDRDALMMLTDILPPDRRAMRSELEKLALYIGKAAKTITLADVKAVIGDAGNAELDDLMYAIGGGEAKRAALLLDRLLDEQTSPVALLRAAQRHFMRLQLARGYLDQGLSAGEAVKRLQPAVFWKYVDAMTAQVRRWPAARLQAALDRLFDAEAAVKRTGTPDQALTSQLLLRLAA